MALSLGSSDGTYSSPAITYLDSSWFAAWQDARSENIYYSIDSGKGWSTPAELVIGGVAPQTAFAPAVADDHGLPVIAWTTGSDQIEYSGFALVAWSGPTTVKGSWGTAGTATSPAIAGTINDGLVVAWTGAHTHHLFYSKYSGEAWQPQVADNSVITTLPPAVAAASMGTSDIEYFAWTNSDDTIGLRRLDGTSATTEPDVPDAGTIAGPALAVTPSGGTVVVSYRGKSSQAVYTRTQVSGTWGAQLRQPQAATAVTPSIAINGADLRTIWAVPITYAIDFSDGGY